MTCVSTDCEIEIRSGGFPEAIATYVRTFIHPLGLQPVIVTDDIVAPLYGESLRCALNAPLFVMPHGEAHKTRATKERLEDALFTAGFDRDSCVIALGGGVVMDMAGYLAATYCRGVALILVPTSLLAMVDASIGGKNGVNVPFGKNRLGCLYPPQRICIDPLLIRSLPLCERAFGAVEMIKHALIADSTLFGYLEHHAEAILGADPAISEQAIFENCRVKKAICDEDVHERGKRVLLNLGHTVGHALEQITAYALPHGAAVALGLLVEGHVAMQLGQFPQEALKRLQGLLVRYGLPLALPAPICPSALFNSMRRDKKSLGGRPRMVILRDIGEPLCYDGAYCTPIEETHVACALHWMQDAVRGHQRAFV